MLRAASAAVGYASPQYSRRRHNRTLRGKVKGGGYLDWIDPDVSLPFPLRSEVRSPVRSRRSSEIYFLRKRSSRTTSPPPSVARSAAGVGGASGVTGVGDGNSPGLAFAASGTAAGDAAVSPDLVTASLPAPSMSSNWTAPGASSSPR